MWLLVVDRPYYPSVDEFDTKDEAEQALAEFLADDTGEGKRHDAVAYVAEVSRRRVAKTDY